MFIVEFLVESLDRISRVGSASLHAEKRDRTQGGSGVRCWIRKYFGLRCGLQLKIVGLGSVGVLVIGVCLSVVNVKVWCPHIRIVDHVMC